MSAIGVRAYIGIKVCHVRRVRFDNFVKYDCKIKGSAVADAVAVESVSTAKFPANREIYRKFFRICSLYEILKADTRANSAAFSEIPYSAEQGIISAEQGILPQEQGILSVKIKLSAG
jgi:hypothetical protein